jgi:hypothetical protein
MYAKTWLSFVSAQWFGVSVSITISILIWLLTATVVYCSTVYDDILGPKFRCTQDNLASYLIVYNRWPYQHTPLFGYWDSYDNKLAVFIEEPYSQLFLTMAIAYLIWFRVVIYTRNHAHERKAEGINH